jgi:hypothetical protein
MHYLCFFSRYFTYKCAFVLLSLFCCFSIAGKDLKIRYETPVSDADQRWVYYVDLLKLALSKSDEPFKLINTGLILVKSKSVQLLAHGESIDIIWSVTSPERETLLQPIRIPLLKGVMGYRVLVVKNEHLQIFVNQSTLKQLSKFKFGQGHDWADTAILRDNGLKVQTSTSYEALFKMLYGGRFDIFPSSIFEAKIELAARPELNLAIEPRLLLKYVSPTYFFTNKANIRLAQRIKKGLWKAIQDGSFDRHFYSHPLSKHILKSLNLSTRQVIELKTPSLSQETRATLSDQRLWFMPNATP